MQIESTISPHTCQNGYYQKDSKKCWWGCGAKRTLIRIGRNVNWVQPVRKIVWRFLKKLKIGLPHDPAIPLLGIYVRENKNTNLSRYRQPSAHSSMIYHHQNMEATSVSINRWVDKLIYVQTISQKKKNLKRHSSNSQNFLKVCHILGMVPATRGRDKNHRQVSVTYKLD